MKKGLLWLGLGYIAGNIIASHYGKKGKKQTKFSEITFKQLVEDFSEIHSKLYEEVKQELLTEENLEKYKKYKKEVVDIFDTYKKKSDTLLKELSKKGSSYAKEAHGKLRKLYDEKAEDIEHLTGIGKKHISFLQEQLVQIYEKLDDKITQVSKEFDKQEAKEKTTKKSSKK